MLVQFLSAGGRKVACSSGLSTKRPGPAPHFLISLAAAGAFIFGGIASAAPQPPSTAVHKPGRSAGTAPAAQVPESAGNVAHVLAATTQFFKRGFHSNRHGALVLGSLRSTRDAGLTSYFLEISKAKDPMLQLTGILDANYVSGNPKILNMRHFFSIPLPTLLTASLAMLIQYGNITTGQLQIILKIAPQPAQRLLAAAALVTRKLDNQALPVLTSLLASADPSVRYYAAMTILETDDAGAKAKALAVLARLAATHSPDLQHIKRALLARAAVKDIQAAIPWLSQIAGDKKATNGTQRRAVTALLYMHAPGAGPRLEHLIADSQGTIDRIVLGLLAIEYGAQVSPASLRVLLKTHSPLQRDIARAGLLAAYHKDPLPEILHLVHQGQPLFLNWVYGYCRNPANHHRLRLLSALVHYATVVDGQRDVDYLRAQAAAKRMANMDSPTARRLLAGFLQSVNHGVVEAALGGMMQSKKMNFGPLVAPVWPRLRKSHDHQIREYAAIVLARAGLKIAMPELRNIVLYNDRRTDGFRAVAGWYYLKLAGRTRQLLHAVAAGTPAK